MIVRCADCGSTHVYDLGIKIEKEKVDISAINHDEDFNKDTLPYYIGGYYCSDCQTFCSIIEESEPADSKPISDKQKDFLIKLIEKLKIEEKYPKKDIDNLNQKQAGKLIWKLKKTYDKKPKKDISPATEKQKKYLTNLIEKSGHTNRYITLDIDSLNVLSAGRYINEISNELKEDGAK